MALFFVQPLAEPGCQRQCSADMLHGSLRMQCGFTRTSLEEFNHDDQVPYLISDC